MYDNLKSLGINQPEDVDRYSLRQEANNDILKIYFRKDKGEFFAKSVKFKYPGLQGNSRDQPEPALRDRRTGSAVPTRSGGSGSEA